MKIFLASESLLVVRIGGKSLSTSISNMKNIVVIKRKYDNYPHKNDIHKNCNIIFSIHFDTQQLRSQIFI